MKKTPEQVSYNMSRVRSKDSKIELALRRELWSRGLRYRKNYTELPGKPDVAFIGPKVAVFCDSEFWHGYDWENRKDDIKTNREFWIPKIERNMARDSEVNAELEALGWTVLRFWGKEIEKNVEGCADAVEAAVRDRKADKKTRDEEERNDGEAEIHRPVRGDRRHTPGVRPRVRK